MPRKCMVQHPRARALTSSSIVLLLVGPALGQFYTPPPAPPFGGQIATSTAHVPKTEYDRPGCLEAVIDPCNGAKITRVVGGDATCRNRYQKEPPWSADGKILHLIKGCNIFLDGNTYKPLSLKKPPALGVLAQRVYMPRLGGLIWRYFHPMGWHKLAGLGQPQCVGHAPSGNWSGSTQCKS